MRIAPLLAILLTLLASAAWAAPLRLHPDNPRYFLLNDQSAILLTSAEHYGAVLNLDFDYLTYLDALQAKGFNYTRIFSGAYREIPGAFNIQRNTLAPLPGRYVCPWARSSEPGYDQGGNKFDLDQWDPAYFDRLKDFIGQAGRRGIVVELVFFCPNYPRKNEPVNLLWKASPLNAVNNINGIGTCDSQKAHTLENGNLLAAQETMTRKIVTELNGFDNLFYEICNEPYFGGVTLEWQAHIAGVIAETEKSLPNKHLIAQNFANHYQKIENLNPLVSIINFHYARPNAVTDNLHLGRLLGDDETGFRGSAPEPYRVEAWQFLMAGGGLFNNLDYTFTVQSPEGRDTTNKAPGSNTLEMHDQLGHLRTFTDRLEFVNMRPAGGPFNPEPPRGVTVHALALGDRTLAAYFATQLDKAGKPITFESNPEEEKAAGAQPAAYLQTTLDLPQGNWRAEWISPLTGETIHTETINSPGGRRPLTIPPFARDIALHLERQ